WAVSSAADIGLAIYLQDAPQFRNMGIASNRLCMFLTMGVPVIASRQPSFEFIEQHNCGVLIDSQETIPSAIEYIASRLDTIRRDAPDCARKSIGAAERYTDLRNAVARLLA